METIEYGVVGATGFGMTHADCIEAIDGADLIAGSARSESSVSTFTKEYDVRGYTDHVDMFEAEDLDSVSVCTPSGTHADIAIDAIERGIDVLVEKPLDVRIERVDRIVKAADEHDATVAGVFQRRFTPERWTAKRWLKEGRFGEVLLADTAVKYHRPQSYYDDWHGTEGLDGGVLLQQAIHFVDLLDWLAGGIESVSADAGTLAHEMDHEDVVVATVRFENGGYGTIEATTGVRGAVRERVEINGTEGSYSSGTFTLGDETVEPEITEPPCGTGLEGQIRDFVGAVWEGREPIVDAEDARKAVEVVLAAYASAELGREVAVSEVRELT